MCTRGGPEVVPVPETPWHAAQFAANSSRPRAVIADAPLSTTSTEPPSGELAQALRMTRARRARGRARIIEPPSGTQAVRAGPAALVSSTDHASSGRSGRYRPDGAQVAPSRAKR